MFTSLYYCLQLVIFRAEDEGEDVVDSDFSIDENDEPVSDPEADESRPKKKRLVTKAYKVCITAGG